MPAAISHRPFLLLSSVATFAAVSIAHATLETPGLGIGHLFYLPIALAALASNRYVGAGAGVAATGLYCLGVLFNDNLPSNDVVTVSTAIRALTYVSSGLLIGWFAAGNRDLVDLLRAQAERDALTGVANVRSFEADLARRCVGPRRFTLLVGDLDGLKEINDREGHAEGNQVLRRVATAISETVRTEDLVARIGGDEFAVLTSAASPDEALLLRRRLETELDRRRLRVSFGWALHPGEGRTPTELFRIADERLYEAKVARKSRETVVALLSGSAG